MQTAINLYAQYKLVTSEETSITITPVIDWVRDEDTYIALVIYPPVDTNSRYHNRLVRADSNIIRKNFGELQHFLTKDEIKKSIAKLQQWQSDDTDNRFFTTYLTNPATSD